MANRNPTGRFQNLKIDIEHTHMLQWKIVNFSTLNNFTWLTFDTRRSSLCNGSTIATTEFVNLIYCSSKCAASNVQLNVCCWAWISRWVVTQTFFQDFKICGTFYLSHWMISSNVNYYTNSNIQHRLFIAIKIRKLNGYRKTRSISSVSLSRSIVNKTKYFN